ncbi:DUF3953 domain-containing protein [Paenisporosarcina sp. FSL H8-0542]|uniref:DUF3953 domain-containing protein n=1 Tax=unclassified Paenisporosarcina TaxID=2642018 RepID=UPI00034E7532|nr:hypothetical protein HMPREF1210_01466 [Paenisporosarcina sp. HGH0030]
MKIIRIILGIIVIALSSYSLISRNFELMPFMMLFLGAFMLVTGLFELQKDRKRFEGYMFIIVSLFIFFVSIQGFLLN